MSARLALIAYVAVWMALACSVARMNAEAHEVRPGLLEVTARPGETYDVLFKQPQTQGRWLAISVTFPEGCDQTALPSRETTQSAVIERWTVHCFGGLAGKTIGFASLDRTLTDVFVRVTLDGGRLFVGLAKPGDPTFTVGAVGRNPWAFLNLGVWHILVGLDHVLFVVLLVLLVQEPGRLLKSVTAFTLAHSLTLAGSTLGFLGLPQKPVEVVIALSIVFLAHEVISLSRGRTTLTSHSPWIPAFAFGLLHGLGFAGALAELGLPHNARIEALLLFNVGVEAGQLVIIAAVVPVLFALGRWGALHLATARIGAAYAIGGLSFYWVIARTVAA